jgi:hypothetical protein
MSMRALVVVGGLVGLSTAASADNREPPVHFEIGINTRHVSASAATEHAAFRSEEGSATDDGTPGGTGVTASLRFTKWMRWNTFAGLEAETGALSQPSSNVAGMYGVFGARGELGKVTLAVELAPGKRWIRYGLQDSTHEAYVVEPRVRAQTWLSPRFTLGAAAGATVTGDVHVWMAGVYVGVHSLDYGTH